MSLIQLDGRADFVVHAPREVIVIADFGCVQAAVALCKFEVRRNHVVGASLGTHLI